MDLVVNTLHEYSEYLVALLLTLPRIYAFLGASQLLNSSTVPAMPRNAAILSLALVVVPINLDHAATFERSASMLALYFAKEFAVGFLAGYVVGWMFWVIQSTGGLIDGQRGAAIASSIDPLHGEESSTLGNLFSQAFLTYIFTSGAFLLVLGILYKSYALWPATQTVPLISDLFPTMALGLFDQAMRLAFVIAAPIMAIMFLAEFALAMISRFAPQVQVYVLAMPIKNVLAIFVLVYYIPVMMPYAERQLVSAEQYVTALYELLRIGEKVSPPATIQPNKPAESPSR